MSGICPAETVSTLKFAHRAKSVRNSAHVNEDADQRTLLRKYEQELRKLRAELQMRQREVVDKRHLLAVSAQSHLCLRNTRAYTAILKRRHQPANASPILVPPADRQKAIIELGGFQM